ncbi:MAG: hypothetical protein WA005_13955 [Candidatus Binataceae bacterium]
MFYSRGRVAIYVALLLGCAAFASCIWVGFSVPTGRGYTALGPTAVDGPYTVHGALTVMGAATVHGIVRSRDMEATGGVSTTAQHQAGGSAGQSYDGPVTVAGPLTVNGPLVVDGKLTVYGALTAEGFELLGSP